jgi:uroporphyrinogen decarboxylase
MAMMHEMTPRQRWLALLQGKQPDRIPTDYWATGEVTKRLKSELGCPDDESLWQRLHIDRPLTVGAAWKRRHHPADPQADMWGARLQAVDYGTGAYQETIWHPLADVQSVNEVHAFQWPDPEEFDYTLVSQKIRANDGHRLIQGGTYEPFLIYCKMRGMEQAFEDLLVNPEIAHAILGHLFDFHYEYLRRFLEAGGGRIDLFYVAEDLGSQTGPLMSVDTYRVFFRENQKKMANLGRSFGAHIFYHTDGAARVFLPDLVDYVGIEILNPIQWRCPTMERETLVRDFGSKVIFHGAIDNQQTLPFGTPEDVAREVRESIAIFQPARWICAPCHNLQPVTPPANILALYDTIWQCGQL